MKMTQMQKHEIVDDNPDTLLEVIIAASRQNTLAKCIVKLSQNTNLLRKIEETICATKFLNKCCFFYTHLTAPNMAASVSNVVIAIVTRPGMDCGGRNNDSQATMTNKPLGKQV